MRDVGFLVMTLPADLPPELYRTGVRPADRLGFTLFLAALIHLALLLGVGFSFVEPKQISRTLEITLATFKSETKPAKADFIAQENQQGSGTLDKKAIPTTTEVAPFQDNAVNKEAASHRSNAQGCRRHGRAQTEENRHPPRRTQA